MFYGHFHLLLHHWNKTNSSFMICNFLNIHFVNPDALLFLLLFSASVFGVSAKSMQCSYDQRGNSVPTILLMLQKRLYSQGGLQV